MRRRIFREFDLWKELARSLAHRREQVGQNADAEKELLTSPRS
jgi:hypothetical protein